MKCASFGNRTVQVANLFCCQTMGTLQKGACHLYGNLGRERPIDLVEEDIIQCQLGLLQFHLSRDPDLTF